MKKNNDRYWSGKKKLTKNKKKIIDEGLKRVIKEYDKTLKLLSENMI